ncbi:MAG TPA: ABC transporter substrate-binding protein [Alphaproteobacteria bacterium]
MAWRKAIVTGLAAGAVLAAAASLAADYDVGADDERILIGSTHPYSGPASAYGAIGRAMSAYFDMVNADGGVGGRRVDFVSLDDGYSPPKTVEQVRKLVEHDRVLMLFGNLGTPTNNAVVKYVNAKGVPHLFLTTGSSHWDQPKARPWSMGFWPSYFTEGKVYANYILGNHPRAHIAVLYQNDDYGKDYVAGLKAGLGGRAAEMVVAEAAYEVTDPTVDGLIVQLAGSAAEVLYDISTPKFSAQAIRRAHDLGWRPLHVIGNGSSSIEAVLKPAGLDKSVGVVTAAYLKDPTDARWRHDADVAAWLAWMERYYPDGNTADMFNVYGYASAYVMAEVLRRCGDELTRANVLRQATSLADLEVPMLLPGILVTTGPDDYRPIERLQPMRFDGARWQPIGGLITAD